MKDKRWELYTKFDKPVSQMVAVSRVRSYFWGLYKKDDGQLFISIDAKVYRWTGDDSAKQTKD